VYNDVEQERLTQMERKRNVGFRFEPELLDRLTEAAKANNWGLSEEVRRRLEATFAAEPPRGPDEKTDELLHFVAAAAKGIEDSYDQPWHHNDSLTEAFLRAAAEVMRDIANPGRHDTDEAIVEPEAPRPGSPLDRILRTLHASKPSIEQLSTAIQFLKTPWPTGQMIFGEAARRLATGKTGREGS
jgi:hypothetical protein